LFGLFAQVKSAFQKTTRVLETNQNLPQLYRFCFLMTGDAMKAQEVFQATLREAALRSAQRQPPADRLWFFSEARWRCLIIAKEGLQPEASSLDEEKVSPNAASQIAQLSPEQLAIWISAAPEPQRSALAAFYLDEFTPREILAVLDLKPGELARALAKGRRQFQAWLNATTPAIVPEE